MFDFTVYSFFAATIGTLFFPSDSMFASLALSWATFGAGSIARPAGGVLIGAYADRFGRKKAITLTIALMAAGTALIGLAPPYSAIGAWAPALVVFGRMLQGFSAGGEIGATTAMLMESAPANARGFMVSWQMASQGAAATCGALVGFALSSLLTPSALQAWGWRIPFLMGALIGPLGYYLRGGLLETYRGHAHRAFPVLAALQGYKREVLTGTLLLVGGTASMHVIVFYLPTYLIAPAGMPPWLGFASTCLTGLVLFIGSPLAAMASDRLRRRKLFVACTRLFGTALIYPTFWFMNHNGRPAGALALTCLLIGSLAISSGATFQLLTEAFPKPLRATGFSLVYSTGVALFGGFAPFIVSSLINATGDRMTPAYYMIACGMISLVALAALPERYRAR